MYIVTQQERENRQITALRKGLGQRRTRTLNKIHRIVNRHYLIWDYPTKTFQNPTWSSLAGADFGFCLSSRAGTFVQCTPSPLESITAGTKNGLESENRLGTVELRKLADLVVVKGDPAIEIT